MNWWNGLTWTWERFGWYGVVRYIQRSIRTRWQDGIAVPVGQAILHLRSQWHKRQKAGVR